MMPSDKKNTFSIRITGPSHVGLMNKFKQNIYQIPISREKYRSYFSDDKDIQELQSFIDVVQERLDNHPNQ